MEQRPAYVRLVTHEGGGSRFTSHPSSLEKPKGQSEKTSWIPDWSIGCQPADESRLRRYMMHLAPHRTAQEKNKICPPAWERLNLPVVKDVEQGGRVHPQPIPAHRNLTRLSAHAKGMACLRIFHTVRDSPRMLPYPARNISPNINDRWTWETTT